jgi:hypothetical protein|tara:strand:- start:23815 stop:24159 length:345 start_codon:yes stop_codon:yes gene_type:complete
MSALTSTLKTAILASCASIQTRMDSNDDSTNIAGVDALIEEAKSASLDNLAVNIKRVDDTFMEWVNAMNTVEAIEAADDDDDVDDIDDAHEAETDAREELEEALNDLRAAAEVM